MSPLAQLLAQFAMFTVEVFIDLVATEINKVGDEAEATWLTVWSFLEEHHGPEVRDNAFAHAVSRGHIQRPTT